MAQKPPSPKSQKAIRAVLTEMEVFEGLPSRSRADIVRYVSAIVRTPVLFRRSLLRDAPKRLMRAERSPAEAFARIDKQVKALQKALQRLTALWDDLGGNDTASNLHLTDALTQRFRDKLKVAVKAIQALKLSRASLRPATLKPSGRKRDRNMLRDSCILALYSVFSRTVSKGEAEIRTGKICNRFFGMSVNIRLHRQNETSRGCDAVAKILSRRNALLGPQVRSLPRVTESFH